MIPTPPSSSAHMRLLQSLRKVTRTPWYLQFIRGVREQVNRHGQTRTITTVASPYAKNFYKSMLQPRRPRSRPVKPRPAGRAALIARQKKERP